MKHVKSFALFESQEALTPRQVKFLDENTRGSWRLNPGKNPGSFGSWRLNPTTGLVDIDGSFSCLTGAELKDLLGIQFGKVSGDFNCSYNKLTTLEGAPQEVGGSFFCNNNQLTSLKGAPQKVEVDFWCYSNELTSLEGAPQEVGGNFKCHNKELTSLKGAPLEVGEYFYLVPRDGFRWTTKGKLEYMTKNPEWITLILPTIPYDSLIVAVSEDPTLLKTIEDFDKVLYNKVLKGLGWDKMGPDLLRQIKDGIL